MARTRKPTAIMEASGAFDRDPARRRIDPETTGELGDPPRHLTPDNKKIWKEIAASLPVGVAKNADRMAFEVLVGLMHRFRNADLSGAQLSSLTGLLSKFGLTPASRASVATPASTKEGSNPFTEFTS